MRVLLFITGRKLGIFKSVSKETNLLCSLIKLVKNFVQQIRINLSRNWCNVSNDFQSIYWYVYISVDSSTHTTRLEKYPTLLEKYPTFFFFCEHLVDFN